MTTVTCGAGVCNGICATNYGDCNSNRLTDGCETSYATDPISHGGCFRTHRHCPARSFHACRRRSSDGGGELYLGLGALVQVLSVAALSAPRGQAWYGASKVGLHIFGEALRAELCGTGVSLLSVYPGPVKTSMGDSGYDAYGGRDNVPRAPEGTPEELARRTVRAVERRRTLLIYPRFYY